MNITLHSENQDLITHAYLQDDQLIVEIQGIEYQVVGRKHGPYSTYWDTVDGSFGTYAADLAISLAMGKPGRVGCCDWGDIASAIQVLNRGVSVRAPVT